MVNIIASLLSNRLKSISFVLVIRKKVSSTQTVEWSGVNWSMELTGHLFFFTASYNTK